MRLHSEAPTGAIAQNAPAPRLDQLTSLRFVAAFGVMLSHFVYLADSPIPGVGATYDGFFRQGGCGVSFFFVLSGFIMAHAYGDRLTSGEIGTGTFLYRRLSRIMPLHWLITLVFAAWLTLIKETPPAASTLLLNLALLHAWSPDAAVHFSLNGPAWSLSDELFFYALFPVLVLMPRRTLFAVTAIGIAAVTIVAVHSVQGANLYSPAVEWFFYVNPLVRLTEFLAGIMVYHAFRAGRGRSMAGTAGEIAAALAIPGAMIGFAIANVPMPLQYQLAYLPIMVAAVLIFAHGRGAVSRLLRAWPLVLLGDASFAFYLTHRPIIVLAHQTSGGTPWRDILLSVALVPICMVVAIGVFLGFERPVMKLLRGGRRSKPASRFRPT